MGYDKPRSLGDSAQAALYTAPIFRDFMKMALKDTPDTPFRVPPGIKLISVDVHTGMRADRAGLDPRSVQARHRRRPTPTAAGAGRRRRAPRAPDVGDRSVGSGRAGCTEAQAAAEPAPIPSGGLGVALDASRRQ